MKEAVVLSEQINVYDGDGKRISKTENGVTTNYYYEVGMLLYTTDEADNRTSLNITGTESNVIAGVRYDNGESVYFYGKDIKGSTSCITDANADVVVSYLYDDWGNTTINGDTTFYNQICYTGGVYDELTKLYYLNSRYYNPETGVFMSQDSVRGSADDYNTWNLYAYCAGNPVCYVDPSGHNPIALAGGGLFITAAVSILGAAVIVGGVYYLENEIDSDSKRDSMIEKGLQQYENYSAKKESSKISKKNTKNQKKTGNNKEPKKNNKTVISKIVLNNIKKKWGQKGIDAFKKAMNKGKVGAKGQSGIKQLKGKPIKGKYTYEIKVKNKEYGDYRIFGYINEEGTMIFDYFDKGLH